MDDCIEISDDEDIQFIEHIVNLDPNHIIIDLTNCDQASQNTGNTTNQYQNTCSHNNHSQSNHKDSSTQNAQPSPQSDKPSDFQSEPEQHSESEPELGPEPEFEPEPDLQPEQEPQHEQESQHEREPQHEQERNHRTDRQFNNKVPPQNESNGETLPQLVPKPTLQTDEQTRTPSKQSKKPQLSDHELLQLQKDQGNEKYHNNRFDDAIRIYRQAIGLAKKLDHKEMTATLHFNLAMTYDKLKYYDQAADECANAVRIKDNYYKAHRKRAEIYSRQNKLDEAVICYEYLSEIDKDNQQSYIHFMNQAKHSKESNRWIKKKDYHQILGLGHDCTLEDLKKAYRKQALNHHPDRHSNADIVTRRIEELRFKEASEAYSFIQRRFANHR